MQMGETIIHSEIEATQHGVIKFATGNTLFIDEINGELRLQNNKNELQLVINIKEGGLTVSVNASELNMHAVEQLNLSSKRININATEQLNIRTGGNLVQQVEKDLLSEVGGTNKLIAQVQKITATLGNVEVKANDDVRLDGERVKLNCD